MLRCTALVLLGAALTACSAIRYEVGDEIEFDRLRSFEPGQTRLGDVLEAMGPPSAIGRVGSGVALLYEYVYLDESQLGLGLHLLFGPGFFEFFKFAYGTSAVDRDAVYFILDRNRVLVDIATSEWKEDFGSSGGLQIFVDVNDVVDSTALRAPPVSLTWGTQLLDPIPVALNAQHRADVEILGSRGSFGQRALEPTLTQDSSR